MASADPIGDILANRGEQEFWSGTLRDLAMTLGALPEKIQQHKREQRMQQVEDMKAQAQRRAMALDQEVNSIMADAMTEAPDGTRRVDRQKLHKRFAQSGIPLQAQQSALKSIDEVESSLTKYAEVKRDHFADVANALLSSDVSQDSVAFALAHTKANGLLTDQEIKPLMEAVAAGQDIRPFLKQIRALSPKYKDTDKPITLAQGAQMRSPSGELLAENPAEKNPTEASLAILAANGDEKAKAALGLMQSDKAAGSDFSQYLHSTYGPNPTPDQWLKARKEFGQADDRPRVNVSVSGGEGALNPDAVEYTATAYRLLGTRAIPTRIAASDRVKILNEAAKQSKALGQSPAAAVTRQLATKADSAALNKIGTMAAAADGFEAKALAQADLIADLSARVPRTKWPLINSALQEGRTRITGDEEATKFANAVDTFAAEYAKIMEGSTGSAAGSSDAARRAAARLINTSMSKGTMAGILDQMRWEMRQTIKGYDAAKEHITERIGGAPPAATVTPTMRYNPATGKVEPIK